MGTGWARKQRWSTGILELIGSVFYKPVMNSSVLVLCEDLYQNSLIIKCTSANIPSGVAGYAVGCLLIATDTGAMYTNVGTTSSCNFQPPGTVIAGVKTPLTATATITAAQVLGGYINTNVGNSGDTFTLPTATALQAVIGARTGDSVEVIIANVAAAGTSIVIAAGSANTTMVGNYTPVVGAHAIQIMFVNTGTGTMDAIAIMSA